MGALLKMLRLGLLVAISLCFIECNTNTVDDNINEYSVADTAMHWANMELFDDKPTYRSGVRHKYTGEVVLPPKYYLPFFSEGMLAVNHGNGAGAINYKGKATVPFIYKSIYMFTNGAARVEKDRLCGFVDSTGKILVNLDYDYCADGFEESYAWVEKGDKYGFVNKRGDLAIPLIYDDAQQFSEGLAAVKKGDKWGFIDTLNQTVIGFEFEETYSFTHNVCWVMKDGKWGLLHRSRKMLTSYKYYLPHEFSENKAWAETINGFVLIDTLGKKHGDIAFRDVYPLKNDRAIVNGLYYYGIADDEGNLVVDMKYKEINRQKYNTFSVATETQNHGLIDKNGKELIEVKYKSLKFYPQQVVVEDNFGQKALFNYKGKQLTSKWYAYMGELYSNTAPVNDGKLFGFIDGNGQVIITPQFDWAGEYLDGLAAAKQGKFGYVNREGKTVIPFEYDTAMAFRHGNALVKKAQVWMVINKANNPIVTDIEEIRYATEGMYMIKSGGKWGYFNYDYNLVTKPIYDSVMEYSNGWGKVYSNGKVGIVNEEGNLIVEPLYDFISDYFDGYASIVKNDRHGCIDYYGNVFIQPIYDRYIDFREDRVLVRRPDGKLVYLDRTGKEHDDY